MPLCSTTHSTLYTCYPLSKQQDMGLTPGHVLQLYKNLLTEASKLSSYNFRMYTLRRIRDKFNENKHLTDSKKVDEVYLEGLRSLELIKRQVLIGSLFKADQLIIEKNRNQ